jgi:Ca-activated chloride channel family protein
MSWLPADFISNFHFLRPLFLLALIPAVLMVLLLRFLQSNQSSWQQAIDPTLLPWLLDKHRTPQQSYPLYGLLALWLLGIVALAGPVWEQNPVPVQEREDALVLVLDLSLSMYAEDLRPNRAVRAQRKIIDILERRRQEGQTGLIVYAGDAHAVTPMTDDVATIGNLVPSLEPNIMPALGSRPATGIALALDLLAQSALPNARILLMTDGIFPSDIAAIGNVLAGTGHTLSVMGFGTEAGAPIPMGQQGYLRDADNAIVIPRLERGPLQQLAAAGGGRYVDAQLTDEDVDFLFKESLLDENLFADTENLIAVERDYDTWNEAGPWLLLLALPFAALAFRRGWLFGIALLVLMAPPEPAYALEWQDLWERKDQQATDAFDAEDYATAAARFRDPAWRAAANYREENYEQVVQDLALLDAPEAHYNRGNALARLSLYEEAIGAYDQTLAQVPEHADALHNRAIVAKLLEEQEQQQQDQQNTEGEQQDQQQEDGEQQQQDQQQQSDEQQQGDQEQQDQEQQEAEEQQNQDQAEQDSEQEQQPQQAQDPADGEQPDSEEEQAMQQWLQRIPDDPGELLRNKFRYQSQQRLFQQLQNPALADQQAAEQIW